MTYLVEAELAEKTSAEEPPSGLAGAVVEVVWQTSPTAAKALGVEEAELQASAGVVPKTTAGLVEQQFSGQKLWHIAGQGEQVTVVWD